MLLLFSMSLIPLTLGEGVKEVFVMNCTLLDRVHY